MIAIPPGTPHSITNIGSPLLIYVSATAPPFDTSAADTELPLNKRIPVSCA